MDEAEQPILDADALEKHDPMKQMIITAASGDALRARETNRSVPQLRQAASESPILARIMNKLNKHNWLSEIFVGEGDDGKLATRAADPF